MANYIEVGMVEFLEREMGENYQDIIEMDFDMSVEEFCNTFIEEDEDGEYYSTI